MKNLIQDNLSNRLLKYSLTAGAILASQSNMNASVVVTSSGHGLPATVNSGNTTYNIDFNNDNTSDIKIGYSFYSGGNPKNAGPFLYAKRNNATAAPSFYGKATFSSFLPYALSQNHNIPTTGKWGFGSFGPSHTGSLIFKPKSYLSHGFWSNQTTAKYLGVRFHLSDGIHYGWVKMTTSGATSATIIAYAYETNPGVGISAPLPVELTSFTALLNENSIELKWNTATEVNNYGFGIERGRNTEVNSQSSNWEQIGFVKGSGNSNSPKNYSFVDNNPLNGDVEYRLKQIDNDGVFKYSSIVTVNSLPVKFELFQNYPNPFNPSTTIRYSIPKAEHVILKVYDELGKEVSTLVDENKEAGNYEVQFNSQQTTNHKQLSSGVYYYRLTAGEFTEVKKLMLLK